MIKFFRKIRQNLLMENKTGKYFKYAIGEIVLVVIGILIALGINNWNENRKKETLKNEYTTALINDYKKDTIQLNTRLKTNRDRVEFLTPALDSIDNGFYTTIEDYIKILYGARMGIRVSNTYNTNSFNLLISSGNIDLFDKKIRTELMELNRLQKAEQTVQDGNKDYMFVFMQNASLKYPTIRNQFNDDIANQLLWNNVKIDDLPRDVSALIFQEDYTLRRYIETTDSVLHQTELVLKMLNKIDD